mgnify:CR=1 FL=1
MGVHLKGHFAPAHFAAVHWRNVAKEMGEGAVLPARRIIMTTSESGLFGGPAQSNYGSAKGGILTMTLVLARELSSYNVTVNCIAPGFFATEMNTALIDNPEFNDWVKKRTPAGRWGEPEDIGNAALFLASKASQFVNGHILYVDGGILANFGYVKGENDL